MPLLEATNLRKSFFGVEVLHGFDLTVEKGEIVGLVGENGSGKSTSMNILGGVFPPDQGMMKINGEKYGPRHPKDAFQAGVNFIHQELNLFPNLTIEENLFLQDFPCYSSFIPLIHRKKIRERTIQLLEEVNLPLPTSTLVANLSQGERQLVEIAKALAGKAQLIIFDEPTTSLTTKEIEKLFGLIDRLRSRGIAMIYISHILKDVLRLCDGIVVLRDGAVVERGRTGSFDTERLITLMVGRTIEKLFPVRARSQSGEPVLEVHQVSQPGIVKEINFVLHRGEVLGLAGLLGSGRSELAQIVFGLAPHEAGTVKVEGKLLQSSPRHAIAGGLAFLTEDRRLEGLLSSASVLDNVSLASLKSFGKHGIGWLDFPQRRTEVAAMTGKVQLRNDDLERKLVHALSGGNQQKVVLAKWLMLAPKILILDEPTRGIDVGAKFEIYKIINDLARGGCAVLLISSEIEELIGMSDRILVMSRGEIAAEFAPENFHPEAILRAAMSKSALTPDALC